MLYVPAASIVTDATGLAVGPHIDTSPARPPFSLISMQRHQRCCYGVNALAKLGGSHANNVGIDKFLAFRIDFVLDDLDQFASVPQQIEDSFGVGSASMQLSCFG
jgi:hypothetical protein